jgi:ribosomal protein S19E (S16A)
MGRERRRLEGAVSRQVLASMERRGWIDRSREAWLTDMGRRELRAWSAERVRPYQLADVVDVPGVAEDE